jgi:hypothetical protein
LNFDHLRLCLIVVSPVPAVGPACQRWRRREREEEKRGRGRLLGVSRYNQSVMGCQIDFAFYYSFKKPHF